MRLVERAKLHGLIAHVEHQAISASFASISTSRVNITPSASPSLAHHVSRCLLAVEFAVLVLPVLLAAMALGALFAGAWMPIALFSIGTDPSVKKVLLVASVWLAAAGSMLHVVNIAALSVAYVARGRSQIYKLSRISRLFLFVGPLFPLGCLLLTMASPSDSTAPFMLMLPGLLLLLPSAHLICACWIADFWSARSGTPRS